MGPTKAYIYHNNLKHNIRLIRKAVGTRKIMAVVKANAYGHGDIEITRSAIESGCEYLGVAFCEEAIRLRESGISTPILVFGAHHAESLTAIISYDIEITITSKEQITYLENFLKNENVKIAVHLKIDTGMNRIGFAHETIADVLYTLKNCSKLELKGVYSHFSTSDEQDKEFARVQIKRFNEVCDFIDTHNDKKILFHMANSGAIMNLPEAYYDMVRPGIMLYGYPPSPEFSLEWELREVMSLRSKIGLIKKLKENEPVSYGRRYYTKENTFIGVIPVGYADGFNRANTNNGSVWIQGKCYPLVGTVCMDMVMVNLGSELHCSIGDDVIIYGEEISITDVASRLNTIPYEVTCNVSPRVPRIHIKD
jgi:alanine racemase